MRKPSPPARRVGLNAAVCLLLLCLGGIISAQTPAPVPAAALPPARQPVPAAAETEKEKPKAEAPREHNLKFDPAPLEMLLKDYSEKTGRTLLLAPRLPKLTVTLRSQGALTLEEYLEAIESVLAMNGVALIKEGERFLKVVPSVEARKESMQIQEDEERSGVLDKSALVSQMITLKYIDTAEAEAAVKVLLHDYAKVNRFERINSMLVTDTAANINRILQLIKQIDRQAPAREEPTVVQIRYAKASDIKKKLEEIIAQSREEQQKKATVSLPKRSGSPGMEQQPVPTPGLPPTVLGVIRPPATPMPKVETPTEVTEEILDLAERGIIRGKVHIVADDRTNKLIIITAPENMKFFNKIIEVLDVATTPDVIVKVIRLEYAEAETVASTLNTLIGGKSKESAPAQPPPAREGETPQERAAALRDYVTQLQREKATATATATVATAEKFKSKVGELSAENIKVLPDKRTNSLIVMANQNDFEALSEIVKNVDMMLCQVLIEAVIMEIELGGSVQTGIDWVQRAMVAYHVKDEGARAPIFAFAGGGGGSGSYKPTATPLLTTSDSISPGSGLTYYFTHFGLNVDAVINMASGDSKTRIISSPVIVTHDNTEGKIDSVETRYFYKGKKWIADATTTGHYEDDVEQKDVGMHLTVKPHINEKKFVVMEITQNTEELGEEQKIGENSWPTVLKRDLKASVAVSDRETIVLGGLVKQNQSKVSRGIPLLHQIPIIGALFGYDKTEKTRSEIVVFLTPYVLSTPEEVAAESVRRKMGTDSAGLWQKGWSDSHLAESGPARGEKVGVEKKPPRPEPASKPETPGKTGPAETPETPPKTEPAAKAEPAPKVEPAPATNRVSNIDPELLQFIERQEKRYGKAIEEANRLIEQEMREPPKSEKP